MPQSKGPDFDAIVAGGEKPTLPDTRDQRRERARQIAAEPPEAPNYPPTAQSRPEYNPGSGEHESQRRSEARQDTSTEEEEGRLIRLTVYVRPDHKTHLGLRKVHGKGDFSAQVRRALDREGICDDRWAK